MVNLFGDWAADLAAIFVIFVVSLVYYIFAIKSDEARVHAAVVSSFLVLVISGGELIGSMVFDDKFYGPEYGLWISAGVFFLALVVFVNAGVSHLANHDGKTA